MKRLPWVGVKIAASTIGRSCTRAIRSGRAAGVLVAVGVTVAVGVAVGVDVAVGTSNEKIGGG